MKNLMMLLMISFLFSACSLKLPDVEFCGRRVQGARCKRFLGPETRSIDNAEWNKPGRVSMSIDDFGKLKIFMLEACERSKKCKIETNEILEMGSFINGF